ncbi:hypothetical protein AB0J14_04325 [Micromonospora arborensis]|uniref:hypothetical protein n=1 Tax=Micromonospora arborensis TaxID=2116518 RepID=UPI0033EC27E4
MTTMQVQHTIPRTVSTTRLLPGPSDEAGWSAETVAEIARVDLGAHTLAHPVPQWGCPFGGCAGADVAYRNPSAELTWLEDARVSPVRHEVSA